MIRKTQLAEFKTRDWQDNRQTRDVRIHLHTSKLVIGKAHLADFKAFRRVRSCT